MGVFACFQGSLPRAPKKCSSVNSACWGESNNSSEEDSDPQDSPTSPIFREIPYVQRSKPHHRVEENKPNLDSSPSLQYREPTRHSQRAVFESRKDSPRQRRSQVRNLPFIVSPNPLPSKYQNSSRPRQIVNDYKPSLDLVEYRRPSPFHSEFIEDGTHSPVRQIITNHKGSPPRQIADTCKDSPPRQIVDTHKDSPPGQTIKTRRGSPPRQITDTHKDSPPGQTVESHRASPSWQLVEYQRNSPTRKVKENRRASPSRPLSVVEDRELSLCGQVIKGRRSSPPGCVAETRKPSPPHGHDHPKHQRPSQLAQLTHPKRPKRVNKRPTSTPSTLNPQENYLLSRQFLQDQQLNHSTTKRLKRRRSSRTRCRAPGCYSPKSGVSDPHPWKGHEIGETLPFNLHRPFESLSPLPNIVPLVLPRQKEKNHYLKDESQPNICYKKVKNTRSDCYFPSFPQDLNVITVKATKTIVCLDQDCASHMGRGGQQQQRRQWVTQDIDQNSEWEQHNDGSKGSGEQTLTVELKREAEKDLAEQRVEEGRMSGSPGITPSVSYAESYCNGPESKFPYATCPDRPISPPGWTYAPKRKNKKGEWWDRDWPQNKRYIYYEPNLQPCGCPWTKRHAGSRTPSPTVSVRSRGMAYADKIVKINRERSLSPQSKSRRNLVPTTEVHGVHQHRHVHLNWSCSPSPRNSPRNPSNSGSRAVTPVSTRATTKSSPATTHGSRPESPRSNQPQTPRTNTNSTVLLSEEQSSFSKHKQVEIESKKPYPNYGAGYCAPLSKSGSPRRALQQQDKNILNGKNYSDSAQSTGGLVIRTRNSPPLNQRPNGQNLQIYVSSSSGGSTPCSITVQRNISFDDQTDYNDQADYNDQTDYNDQEDLDETDYDETETYQEKRPKDVGRKKMKKYVGNMGHCHTPGSWSCTPQDSYPNTPRSVLQARAPMTPRRQHDRTPITSRANAPRRLQDENPIISRANTPRRLQDEIPIISRANTPRRPTATTRSDYTVTITCPSDNGINDDVTDMTGSGQCCNCLCHCPCTQKYVEQGCCNDGLCPATPRRTIGGSCNWNQIVYHHRPHGHCCCSCCHF